MSTSDVPRSVLADYHREATAQLRDSVAAVAAQLKDLLERAQAAAVFGTHPELIDLDGTLDGRYANEEDCSHGEAHD